MQLRQVQYLDEPLGVVPVWHRLAGLQSASPKVWMDAYLAAFAIAGELQMVTFDRDFKSYMRYGLNLSIPGESV